MIVYRNTEVVLVCDNTESEKLFLAEATEKGLDISSFERLEIHGIVSIARPPAEEKEGT